MAVPSPVAIENRTPPGPAGCESDTTKVATVGLRSPSVTVTSPAVSSGSAEGMGVPETSRSSMPTHSSLPAALVVRIRSCTNGRLSAAAGRTRSTGVERVASFGPVVASATKAAGTFTNGPAVPTRYCSATGWIALSADPSTSRSSYRTRMPP